MPKCRCTCWKRCCVVRHSGAAGISAQPSLEQFVWEVRAVSAKCDVRSDISNVGSRSCAAQASTVVTVRRCRTAMTTVMAVAAWSTPWGTAVGNSDGGGAGANGQLSMCVMLASDAGGFDRGGQNPARGGREYRWATTLLSSINAVVAPLRGRHGCRRGSRCVVKQLRMPRRGRAATQRWSVRAEIAGGVYR